MNIDQAREKIRQAESAVYAAKAELDDIVSNMLKQHGLQGNLYAPVDYFAWSCPDSPTGFCVYDMDEDPCNDSCLFCGHPDERK